VKTGSGTITTNANIGFHNAGAVDIQAGSIALLGGGTQSGPFTMAPAGTLRLGASTTFQATSSITGGTLEVTSGTSTLPCPLDVALLNVTTGGILSVNGAATLDTVTINGGTVNVNVPVSIATLSITSTTSILGGSGAISVTDSLTWTLGTMGGSGSTTLLPGATSNLVGNAVNARLLSRAFTLQEDATISGAGGMNFNNGSLTVSPGVTLTVDGVFPLGYVGGAPKIFVNGTLVKSGAGAMAVNSGSLQLINNGTVAISGGSLTALVTGSIPQMSGTTLTGGAWILEGTTLAFPTGTNLRTLASGASVTLDGAAATFTEARSPSLAAATSRRRRSAGR
jgi:hypothetical protein